MKKEIVPLINQLYQLLNPEGQLVIVDFDFLPSETDKKNLLVHPGFDQKALGHSLIKLGFDKVKNEKFFKGKKNFMNTDAEMFIMVAHK